MIIALIVADEFELKVWPGQSAVFDDHAPFKSRVQEINNHTVFVLHSGIGLVNAAAATMYAITVLKAAHIVNYGVVGATKSHPIGSVVFPHEVYHIDVKTPWYPDGVTPREKPCYATTTKASKYKLGSSSQFISSEKLVESWIKKGVTLFDMEGVAITQVGSHFNVPVTLVKAVSDHLDATPSKLEALNAQIEAAAIKAAGAALEVIKKF